MSRLPQNGARALPLQPNLEHLKNEAKHRLAALRETAPDARLTDAQFQLAREYGFASWRALKEEIEQRTGVFEVDSHGALTDYAGFYRYEPGIIGNFFFSVSVEGGRLFLQGTGGAKIALSRQSDGWFMAKGLSVRYGFSDIEDGVADTMWVAMDGRFNAVSRIDDAAAEKEKISQAAAAKENNRPRIRVEPAPEILARYAGHYLSPLGRAMEIIVESERLFVKMSGQGRLEFLAESETTFFFWGAVRAQMAFRLEKDRPSALIFYQNGLFSYFYPSSALAAAKATEATARRLAEQTRPRTAISVDPKLFSGYAGRYRVDEQRVMDVTIQDGKLFAQITGQDHYELFPETERDFFFTVVAAQLSFIADDGGRISHAVLHQAGRDMPLMRVSTSSEAATA